MENAVDRAVVLSQGDEIGIGDLPPEIVQAAPIEGEASASQLNVIQEATRTTERDFIIRSLLRNSKNIAEAAKELGIHRSTLYRKIERLEIDLELL